MGLYVKKVRKKEKIYYYLTDGSSVGGKSFSRLIRSLTKEEIEQFESKGRLEIQPGIIIENPHFKPPAESLSKDGESPSSTVENKKDTHPTTPAVVETPGRAVEVASEPMGELPSQPETRTENTLGKGESATSSGETEIRVSAEIHEHPLKSPPTERVKIPATEKKEPVKIPWPVGIEGLKLTSFTHKIIDVGGGFYELEPKLLGSERGHVLVAKDGEVYCGTCRLSKQLWACEHTQAVESAMKSSKTGYGRRFLR